MRASSRKNGASVGTRELSPILSLAEWEYLRAGWGVEWGERPQVVGTGWGWGEAGRAPWSQPPWGRILSIWWHFWGELRAQR